MNYAYDLVITAKTVVDPINKIHGQYSIGIKEGKIKAISTDDLGSSAKELLVFEEGIAVPGLIDMHTHIGDFGARGAIHMLAKAGVCTALDLAGPGASVFSRMQTHGAGLNVATLEAYSHEKPKDTSPDASHLDAFVEKALKSGSLGIKLLGGHFPITPEASGRLFASTRKFGAYFAWHAGSTKTCNNIEALREVLEISAGHPIHVAHINTYCRGIDAEPLAEVQAACKLLEQYPNAYSEAYLAGTNGTSLVFGEDGKMQSRATAKTLMHYGYEESEDGLCQAILDGVAKVFAPKGMDVIVLEREEALEYWKAHKEMVEGGFNVNPGIARMSLCLAKNSKGDFIVDAISTDGGGIPRNIIIPYGLALVKMGCLTLEEFVVKTSYHPSRMLCLQNKGHFSPGADADITIMDMKHENAIMTMVGGKIVMLRGVVLGREGTIITTPQGEVAVKATGLPVQVVDPSNGPIPFGRHIFRAFQS